MTLPVGDLFAAIERNDGQAVSRYLRTASEAERRAVSGKVRALCSRNWNFHGDRSATVVAMLGTAGGVRPIAQVIGPLGVQQWTEEAIAVLRERKPAWLPDLPRALLTGNEFRNNWCFVRDLVRAGLVPKPDVPEYIIRMPQGLASRAWLSPWNRSIVTIEDQLRADPELLGNEVFELFRIEGSATSLYWADGALSQGHEYRDGKYVKIAPRPEATWRGTLARLARGGLIDFNRLLDEAITVFLRDLRPTHFGWYVDMHDELAPTLDEMAAREAQYLRLLAADTSLGVGVGQRALEQLLRADRLDVESFVHAAGPALARGEKGIVVKQMKLLDLALKQRPDLGATVHEALSPALAHERREIQEAARALAERLSGGKNLGTAPSTGLGPPSQPNTDLETGVLARAARLVKHPVWGPQIQSSLTAIRAGEAPPASTISAAAGRSLQPISDPEEVVDAFIRLVESAGDPVLIERAIAGAVRTGLPAAQRARIAAPLAKRAREQLPAWPSGLTSGDVRAMAASVAYTWSTGTRVTASFDRNYTDFAIRHSSLDEHLQPVTPTGVMAVRCIEAIDLIAKGAQTELLAEPTHERGAIDPEVFLERLQKSSGGWFSSGAPRFDLEVAALRIRPGALDASVGKLPRAIRDQTTALLSDVPAWIETEVVSDRPTEHRGDDAQLVVLARVAKLGGRSSTLQRLSNLSDPIGSYFRLSGEGEFTSGYGAAIRTWPLITPWLPDLTAAHLLRPLSRALQPGKHDHGPAAVACLLHPDTPLEKIGHLALAMGCMGAEGDTRTAAGDVFAGAAKDGRLQPALMAEAWLELAQAGAFQAKRLESTLRPVSTLHACGLRLAQALQLALGPLLATGVRDMHVLIRLAASVGEAYGVFPDDPRVVTAGAKPSTELAKALRALAGARSSEARMLRAASVELLEGLIDRV